LRASAPSRAGRAQRGVHGHGRTIVLDKRIATMSSTPPLAPAVMSVGRFVASARLAIERAIGPTWVAGEVSGFMRAASGHCYFTLKDAEAQVRCVLWRTKAMLLDVKLANGMAVEVRAAPTIYEARGDFQLNVDAVRLAGAGALYEKFARLKAKLEAAGWFAPERKRPLPGVPARGRARDVDAGGGAARHAHDAAAPLARRCACRLRDAGPGRRRGRVDRRGDPRRQRARRGRRADRRARRRLDRGPVGVQRGGRRARDRRLGAAGRLRRRPRDRLHDRRLRRRRARADADRRRGAGRARPRRDVQPRARAGGAPRARVAHAVQRGGQRVDLAARGLVHPKARLDAQRDRVGELALRLSASARRAHERAGDCSRRSARASRASSAARRRRRSVSRSRPTAGAAAARAARRRAQRASRRSRRASRCSIRRRCSSAATRS
jgi:exodeoxyribonuclease VII large subunit